MLSAVFMVLIAGMLASIGGGCTPMQYSRTIYVDPVRGSNNESCLINSSPENSCRNLSFVFRPQYRRSSTLYILQPGIHYLDDTASKQPFIGFSDIAISGSGRDNTTILCFINNSGLSFIDMENVIVANVTLTRCSSLQNGTSHSKSTLKLLPVLTAAYFSHCDSTNMTNVVVSYSPNGSAITIYNSVGINTFSHCHFANNSGWSSSEGGEYGDGEIGGGGGVYIEFSYCQPGSTKCKNDSQLASTSNSYFSFIDCQFVNNNAYFSGGENGITFFPHGNVNHVSYGQGGGLSIFFCGNATNNNFSLSNVTFSNNSAIFGGGLYVEFADISKNNSVTTSRLSFLNNTSEDEGGGANILCYSTQSGNSVVFFDANFTNNEAIEGGGGGVKILSAMEENMSVSLSQCKFHSNRANFGAAMSIMLSFSVSAIIHSPRHDHYVTISNCSFLCNSISNMLNYTHPVEVGMGVLFMEGINAIFQGSNYFQNNKGSALTLIGSAINLTNTSMTFFNNSAQNGGAMVLLSSSKLLISSNTSMTFDSNRAFVKGGAIYSESMQRSSYEDIEDCFIIHEKGILIDPNDWGASFTFSNNSNSRGKNAIHTTTALSCDSTRTKNLSSVFCWENWSYHYSGIDASNCSNYITTDTGNITIDKNANFSHYEKTFFVNAYPGEKVMIPVSVYDDFYHNASTIFSATAGGAMGHASLDSQYSYIFNNQIKVLGKPTSSIKINLHSIGNRMWHVYFIVNLTECPPGLTLTPLPCNESDNSAPMDYYEEEEESEGYSQWQEEDLYQDEYKSLKCECIMWDSINQAVVCNSSKNASLLSGYWMGLEEDNEYAVSPCPSGFCRSAPNVYIPLPRNNLCKHICGVQNREGRLCGKCRDGYGPAINSRDQKCVPCIITWHQLARRVTYYILAVYVPLFLLFLAIIVFNIKLTAGPANAFILFGQLISSSLNITADDRIPLKSISPNIGSFLLAYKFIYGIFNLKFFQLFVPKEALCLGKDLTALDVFLMDYAVAFFPLLMIVVIILVYKITGCCNRSSSFICKFIFCRSTSCCTCCHPLKQTATESSDRLRRAMVPAFASFILLSYTKFTLTSFMILTPAHLILLSGRKINTIYFYYAAQHSFSDVRNILQYILPAVVVIAIFVAIPPLFMLDYPLRLLEKFLRLSRLLWRLYPSVKIHIMLDAFQGCYQDRYRWFAGLYFVFRLLINLTNALCDDLQQFFLQEFYCIFFALLVSFLRPYRRRYHLLNYFDSLIFLNLAVINLITLYLFANTRRGAKPSVLLFSLQYILVFLPLVCMIGYVIWSTVPFPRLKERITEWFETRQQTKENETLIEDSQEESSDTPDEVDWSRAQDINRYKKSPNPPLHSSVPRPSGLFSLDDDQLRNVCANDTFSSPTSSPTTTIITTGSSGRGSGRSYGSTGIEGTTRVIDFNTTSTSGVMSTSFDTYSTEQ